MTMPVQQAIVSGPVQNPNFVTLFDVTAAPSSSSVIVFTWNTDQSVQLQVQIWDPDFPNAVYTATEAAAAIGRRQLLVTLGAPLGPQPGQQLEYLVSSVTAPPPTLRPFQNTVRIPGGRSNPLPVRFYAFGGNPPAPAGGTGGQGGGTGNWNQYTWAQYNPKQTTYPTP